MVGQAPLSPSSTAAPLPLPAYAQLFSEIGLPRTDDDVLPAYTPQDTPPVVDFDTEAGSLAAVSQVSILSAPSVPAGPPQAVRGGMDMDRSEIFREEDVPAATSDNTTRPQEPVEPAASAEVLPKAGPEDPMQDGYAPPSPFGGSADERVADAHNSPSAAEALEPTHDFTGYPTLGDLLRYEDSNRIIGRAEPRGTDVAPPEYLSTALSSSSSLASHLFDHGAAPAGSLHKAAPGDHISDATAP